MRVTIHEHSAFLNVPIRRLNPEPRSFAGGHDDVAEGFECLEISGYASKPSFALFV